MGESYTAPGPPSERSHPEAGKAPHGGRDGVRGASGRRLGAGDREEMERETGFEPATLSLEG